MHFRQRVSPAAVHEHHSVDDCALNATSEGDMQRSMDLFAAAAAACSNCGLVINTEKSAVMQQPPPDAVYIPPQINVNGAKAQVTNDFAYLGSTPYSSIKIDDEVARRISKASQAFGRPQSSLESPRSSPQHQT
ncbi:hypothetical protein SprV_0301195100 [Sparganum proliferum]